MAGRPGVARPPGATTGALIRTVPDATPRWSIRVARASRGTVAIPTMGAASLVAPVLPRNGASP